jgi:hypothetical protein
MKRKQSLILVFFGMAFLLFFGCGTSNNTVVNPVLASVQPGRVSGERIYTASSNGEIQYSGRETVVCGFIDGRELGEIGKIYSDGLLTLDIPIEIKDNLLSAREGTVVKGGTLATQPEIHPWKSVEDMMVLVYVNKSIGSYQTGWNYANMQHEMVPTTDGYKWVIIDNTAE